MCLIYNCLGRLALTSPPLQIADRPTFKRITDLGVNRSIETEVATATLILVAIPLVG